jgi:hypothetical protein
MQLLGKIAVGFGQWGCNMQYNVGSVTHRDPGESLLLAPPIFVMICFEPFLPPCREEWVLDLEVIDIDVVT